MSPERRTFLTEDGSRSVYSERFGASYHSTHGALQETQHVFVQAGLAHVAQHKTRIRILDVGFGTGLNFLCSAAFAKTHHLDTDYVGVEAYPLGGALLEELSVGKLPAPSGTQSDWAALDLASRNALWECQIEVAPGIRLTKQCSRIEDLGATSAFDLVYYDAFAPITQPELWTPEIFSRVYHAMRPGGVLVTYCARGQVRRDLEAAGFRIERLAGPPGKREMLRGTKSG